MFNLREVWDLLSWEDIYNRCINKFSWLALYKLEDFKTIVIWVEDYMHNILDRPLLGSEDNVPENFIKLVTKIVLHRSEILFVSYDSIKSFMNENEGIVSQLVSNTPFEFTGKIGDFRDLRSRVQASTMSIDWHQIKMSQSKYIKDVVYHLDKLYEELWLLTVKFEAC